MKLISQIKQIIFLAFPVEDRERGERGRHIAKYLKGVLFTLKKFLLENYLSQLKATIVRMEAYIIASVTTILTSQAKSPNGQGYCCHIRYSSLGIAKMIILRRKNCYHCGLFSNIYLVSAI